MADNSLSPVTILSSGSMTGTSTLTSSVVDVREYDVISIQCDWTGTPTGTFYVDVSLNYAPTPGAVVAGTWTSLPVGPSPAPAGAAGTAFMDIAKTGASWIRVRYVNASGTGTLTTVILGGKRA